MLSLRQCLGRSHMRKLGGHSIFWSMASCALPVSFCMLTLSRRVLAPNNSILLFVVAILCKPVASGAGNRGQDWVQGQEWPPSHIVTVLHALDGNSISTKIRYVEIRRYFFLFFFFQEGLLEVAMLIFSFFPSPPPFFNKKHLCICTCPYLNSG